MVPADSRYVIYCRVSTAKQGRSGLGLEAQKASVDAFLRQVNGTALASFVEVESGKVNERPQLEKALQRCRQTGATLLVAKLDRLSRNAAFLLNLKDSQVRFRALDIPGADTLSLGIMATLAQHEREIISQRTRAALAARKARGLKLGTPRNMTPYAKRAAALSAATNSAKARQRAELVKPAIDEARESGLITLTGIASYLNERSITTPRGKSWTPTAVRNTLTLLGER